MVDATIRVIYGDTDQMGVVYYANYFRYFEFARSELFRACGGSYRDMEAEGLLLPVVEANCQYRASARYDDLLRIRTTVELGRASMSFHYELRKEGQQAVLCVGKTVHACINRDGRPVRIPEWVRKMLSQATEKSRGEQG